MSLEVLFNQLISFPTGIFSFLFTLGLIFMFISVMAGFELDINGDGSADVDFNADTDHDLNVFGKIMVVTGLSRVPLIIGLTVSFFFSTIISYFLQYYVLNSLINENILFHYIFCFLIMFVSFFASIFIAGFILKPLEGIFDNEDNRMLFDYINKKCRVCSVKVDAEYGEVVIEDGPNEYFIFAYSDEILNKDDEAIVLKYDEKKQKYLIKKIN